MATAAVYIFSDEEGGGDIYDREEEWCEWVDSNDDDDDDDDNDEIGLRRFSRRFIEKVEEEYEK